MLREPALGLDGTNTRNCPTFKVYWGFTPSQLYGERRQNRAQLWDRCGSPGAVKLANRIAQWFDERLAVARGLDERLAAVVSSDQRLAVVIGAGLFVVAGWPLLALRVPPYQDLP